MTTGVVVCNVCGHKMALPPGFENASGRCTKCGSAVGAAHETAELKLEGFDDIVGLRKKPESKPAAKAPVDRVARAKRILKESVYSGAIVAGVCAVAFMPVGLLVTFVVAGESSKMPLLQILKVSGGFGATLGFMLGSIWGACHRADLGHFAAIVFGVAIGVPLCLLNFALFAPRSLMPEAGIFEFLLAGVLAGAVSGALLGIRGED